MRDVAGRSHNAALCSLLADGGGLNAWVPGMIAPATE
jgi:hypothetical protein